VNCYIKVEGKEETYVFEFILIFECKVGSVLIGIFFKEFEYFKLILFIVVLELAISIKVNEDDCEQLRDGVGFSRGKRVVYVRWSGSVGAKVEAIVYAICDAIRR
jgi:hypothetical protein